MVHNGLPLLCATLRESSDEDDTTSSTGGSLGSLGPRGCNVVTSTDPIITPPAPDNSLVLQTILMATTLTVTPQPGMEPLPDQQQAYQEEQQARACAR
jgi:hypothetical protein